MAKKKSGNKKKVMAEQTKPIQLTRKELRKEKRQQKKQAKINYFEMKSKNRNVDVSECTAEKKKVTFNLSENKSKNVTKGNLVKSSNEKTLEMKSHQRLLVKMKEQRKRQLLDANKEEEREIKFLEKRLKLGNKKDISSSKGFADCGLDYILDACNPDKINSEVNFEDSDSDFYEDYKLVQKNNDIENDSTKLVKNKKASLTDNKESKNIENKGAISKSKQSLEDTSEDEAHLSSIESDEDPPNFSDAEDSFNDSDVDLSENELESNTEDDEKTTSTKGETWEDIYGRLRDKKGNILEQNKGKYVPPHLRVTNDGEDQQKKIILKQLKSLMNKLIINNIHSISSQVEDLFAENSRHAMTDAIYTLYMDSIISPILSTKRSVIDHAMLIAVLHANVGSEIGACLIQKFIEKLISLLSPSSQDVENKETDNLILLISYLYNFKLFEARLMYDILKKLSNELTEKNVDLILAVLKSVGFILRKDDPLAMKDFLLLVQKYMNKLPEVEDQSRMKYMLDVLLNIKNNNLSKVSDYDPSEYEYLKKTLNSVIRSGNSIVPLAIGLEDILNVEEKGRWWLVGSAWNKGEEIQKPKKDVLKGKYSSQLLQLAKKQNMNTENRRNVFCILLSAEDYQDAFQKLVKLGLKGLQEREIPHVLIHCLIEEKNYNPYYAHVADQICMSDRRHQISLQCALWDKFKALEKLKSSQINILAKFLSQLFLAGSLPISVLKVVEFAELDKSHIRLLRQTILTLVSEEALDSMKQVFIRVSKAKKLSLFREALRLFIHHFILRNLPDEALKERVDLIISILGGEAS